jgi:hypothetical protein
MWSNGRNRRPSTIIVGDIPKNRAMVNRRTYAYVPQQAANRVRWRIEMIQANSVNANNLN